MRRLPEIKLRINGLENPVGVNCSRIRISCFSDFFEGKNVYRNFELKIASAPELLKKPDILEAEIINYEAGYILRSSSPFKPFYIRATVPENRNITTDANVVTAPKNMSEAYWIGGAGYTFLRKKISIESRKKKIQAFLFVLAEAHSYARERWMDGSPGKRTLLLGNSFIKYKIWVNGHFGGCGPFRSIADGKSVLHGFDISQFIQPGNNIISILSMGEKKGIALLGKVFSEGKCIASFKTDSSWKKISGNEIIRPVFWEQRNIDNYFKGSPGPGELHEHINGRVFPFGWTEINFDDHKWKSAESSGRAYGDFELSSSQNYFTELVYPKKIKCIGKNSFFVDFGKEIVGSAKLISERLNEEVEIRLGEETIAPKKVRFQMRTGNCYQEIWNFAQKKKAELEHFGIRAFRYAEIHNWQTSLNKKSISVRRLSYPFNKESASFTSSDPVLNKIWEFCKYSIKTVNMDLYIDCPSRERIAYEADAYITMLSHFCLDTDYALASRTAQYFIEHSTYPLEWKLFIAPIFYAVYMQSGDICPLKKYYKTIIDKYSFLSEFEDGLRKNFPFEIIVDWPSNMRDNYEFGNFNTVANAFLFWEALILSEIATAIAKKSDAKYFRRISTRIKKAFNKKLFDSRNGLYIDSEKSTHSSLHANMFALRFGLVPQDRIKNCLDFIVSKGMACGVYPAQFLLETLFKYGKAEDAILLIGSRKTNGWMNMINSGATICMEVWDARDKSNASMAHPWSSAPANIIPRYLFGIRPLSPGWKTYSFVPSPGHLDWAEIKIPTPRGPINASFKYENGKLKKSIDGPEGCLIANNNERY